MLFRKGYFTSTSTKNTVTVYPLEGRLTVGRKKKDVKVIWKEIKKQKSNVKITIKLNKIEGLTET